MILLFYHAGRRNSLRNILLRFPLLMLVVLSSVERSDLISTAKFVDFTSEHHYPSQHQIGFTKQSKLNIHALLVCVCWFSLPAPRCLSLTPRCLLSVNTDLSASSCRCSPLCQHHTFNCLISVLQLLHRFCQLLIKLLCHSSFNRHWQLLAGQSDVFVIIEMHFII